MDYIRLKINDKENVVLLKDGMTLANLLRDEMQLTGTKVGCEEGACGACTVLMDGKPVLSCITPAMRCDGAEIVTIEGIAKGGELDLLQQKFIERGALQCGFCTPGMIMTAKHFLDEHPDCTADEIREALSGNLCRCTGYQKIIDAVAETAMIQSGRESCGDSCGCNPAENGVVGSRQPLLDSRDKVTGTAEYADDFRKRDSLYCKFLRSPHPHARIEQIDISAALQLPGVRSILTGKTLPGKFGVLPISQDQTAMAVDKVRYVGEIIAAVAADSEAIAEEALKYIRVSYQPLQVFENYDDSLKDIPEDRLIHPHSKKHGRNIHKSVEMRFGDQEKDFQHASFKSEMDFDFPGISHGFIEPHACTAWWNKDGELSIVTATQVPHYLHRALAKVLEVPLKKVRVIKPAVGGGFGGKSDPFAHEIIAAQMARQTGKPVRVRLSREEVFLTNHGRHPTRLNMKAALNEKGKITSVDADIQIDGGAFGSFGVVSTYYNGVLLQAPYDLSSFGFKSTRLYTNKPPSGAMRGHGGVNPRFAMEILLDDLAHQSGIDPCELRLSNFLPPESKTLGEFRITSNGARDAVQAVMDSSGWKEKYGQLPAGKGIGMACGFYISGSALPIIWNKYPQSVVHLKLDFDGRVVVYSGASDIGQGSDTMLAMIVAEVLGIPVEWIFVHGADTLFTPVDLGSYSSRVTFMAGNAAKMAAENLKKDILEKVALENGCKPGELEMKDGRIFNKRGKVDVSWDEAAVITTNVRGAVTASGWYNSPKLGGDFKGSGAGLSPSYSFGAAIAEVEVDLKTGMFEVTGFHGAHDCGRALNPLAVEGQLEGSWHMGMGQAVSEAMQYYKGLILNPGLLDYKMPTSLDTPSFNTHIIESQDPEGPFGAKECGEGALHPSIPAIANAIFNACGVRITALPITAEKILAGIQKQKEKEVVA